MEIVQNTLTGLPELPEGHYWKVTDVPEPFGQRSRVIALMRKRFRRNGKPARKDESVDFQRFDGPYVHESWDYKIDVDKSVEENRAAYEQHTKECIQQAAEMVLKRQYRKLVRVALEKEGDGFYGKYPPKSL